MTVENKYLNLHSESKHSNYGQLCYRNIPRKWSLSKSGNKKVCCNLLFNYLSPNP